MGEAENSDSKQPLRILPTSNRQKELLVSGRLVTMRDKSGAAATESAPIPHKIPGPVFAQIPAREASASEFPFPGIKLVKGSERQSELPEAPEVLTLEELARHAIEGLDYFPVMDQLTDMGPEGRLLLFRRNGKLLRYVLFEDPRICKDIQRGGVIHNLEQKPVDVSGWRVHEFYIDSKGCLGAVCTRCTRVCPESAIHLRGEGAESFCEIDPAACKGCYICWVECTRKAADCILVDGKAFHSELRAAHFGE